MKAYVEVVENIAKDAFNDMMNGGAGFPATRNIAEIYEVSESKLDADISEAIEKIRKNNFPNN